MIPGIILAWNARQEELERQGLQTKRLQTLLLTGGRIKIYSPKLWRGLFTLAAEVHSYLVEPAIHETSKVSRQYLEVCYGRDTFLSLSKTSDIFRLLKDFKKLPLTTYANNI